jgi:hypothetical protein
MILKETQRYIDGAEKCNAIISDAERKISARINCLISLNDISKGVHGNSINKLLWDVRQELGQIGEARKHYSKNCKAIESDLYHALAGNESPNT